MTDDSDAQDDEDQTQYGGTEDAEPTTDLDEDEGEASDDE